AYKRQTRSLGELSVRRLRRFDVQRIPGPTVFRSALPFTGCEVLDPDSRRVPESQPLRSQPRRAGTGWVVGLSVQIERGTHPRGATARAGADKRRLGARRV